MITHLAPFAHMAHCGTDYAISALTLVQHMSLGESQKAWFALAPER
jgi:hypothetical protein